MICLICEVNKVEKNSPDPDCCLDCQKRIQDKIDNPLNFARSYGMILDCCRNEEKREEGVNLAGIELLFPEMSAKKKRELFRAMCK